MQAAATQTRRYYVRNPRGFANEYRVAMATTPEQVEQYESAGWDRVTRKEAEQRARYQGDAATEAYVGYEIDGTQVYRDEWIAAL